MSAKNSRTSGDEEELYTAAHAIDLHLDTLSRTVSGPDGESWLKIDLGKEHCVKHVISYNSDGSSRLTWTCSKTNCSACEGQYCSRLSLSVSSEGVSPCVLSPDCKSGDVVVLEAFGGGLILVWEIAVTEDQSCDQGKLK